MSAHGPPPLRTLQDVPFPEKPPCFLSDSAYFSLTLLQPHRAPRRALNGEKVLRLRPSAPKAPHLESARPGSDVTFLANLLAAPV